MQPPLTITNLASDESFINYCLNNNAADIAYWQQFEASHPELHPLLQEAAVLVLALHLHGELAECAAQKIKLRQLMWQESERETPQRPKVYPLFIRIAAAVTLLFIAFGAYYQWKNSYSPEYIIVGTQKGERKKFVLPDNSVIWLNAATTLRFKEKFASDRSLELLDGEAYFQVAHDSLQPFTVTTASGMKVTDLGTAFVIKSYTTLTEEKVGVVEGIVAVSNSKYKADAVKAGQATVLDKITGTLRMEPYAIATANWRNGAITLTNVSFEELRQDLERLYNIQVVFDTPGIGNCRITASFNSTDPLTKIMDALHMIYGITYTNTGNIIHIKGQPCQ
ncbi:FecR family protein [Chitinophaga sp. Hz27]|uniref:FecR family protein n=1 Tax=Chitinophaga sp. Hz27 TaxID=3347169 RepID=UPI0035E10BB6